MCIILSYRLLRIFLCFSFLNSSSTSLHHLFPLSHSMLRTLPTMHPKDSRVHLACNNNTTTLSNTNNLAKKYVRTCSSLEMRYAWIININNFYLTLLVINVAPNLMSLHLFLLYVINITFVTKKAHSYIFIIFF